jgi:hypothetical protein
LGFEEAEEAGSIGMEFLVQPVNDRSNPPDDAISASGEKYFALSVLPERMATDVQQQPLFADKGQDSGTIVLINLPSQAVEVAPVARRSDRRNRDSAAIHHALS